MNPPEKIPPKNRNTTSYSSQRTNLDKEYVLSYIAKYAYKKHSVNAMLAYERVVHK